MASEKNIPAFVHLVVLVVRFFWSKQAILLVECADMTSLVAFLRKKWKPREIRDSELKSAKLDIAIVK